MSSGGSDRWRPRAGLSSWLHRVEQMVRPVQNRRYRTDVARTGPTDPAGRSAHRKLAPSPR
ncbi:hypothetical protein FTX61_02475 [Nitriliruptoraceae bacterium ZYF776]|nr:hypothetical protein [Profundirhabdus halotolerans]